MLDTPTPHILHPYPDERFLSSTEVRAVCGNAARTDLRGGLPERAVPTATEIPAEDVPVVRFMSSERGRQGIRR